MQAPSARKAGRSLLFALVLVAHALLIALLILVSDTVRRSGERSLTVRAVILLPARYRPVHFAPVRLRRAALVRPPITAPITLRLAGVQQPIPVPPPINWAESARQAVQAVLRRRHRVAIGFPAGAHSRRGLSSKASGIHSQGPESYRTDTGEHVARGSGNCYVISGPPPIDASRLEQQAQMSTVTCAGRQHGPPPDNLFKNLPAYKRYHTLPRRALPRRRHRPRPPRAGSG
ncbi:MAG: hypothetical protein ACP5P4_08790 [Steroidobacteraceae bacterium]